MNIMKTMYAHIQSAVRLGVELTDWFSVDTGVRQRDNLAPALFAIYINDCITAMEALNKGLPVGDDCVSCLAYADDVLVASSHEDLQAMLDAAHVWCTQWRLEVNTFKTKIMHFRKKSVSCSDFQFHLGTHNLEYCSTYRYLGLDMNTSLDYSHCVDVISSASSRAFGASVSRYYAMKGLHYGTYMYSKLYNSLVTPVMDYACGIWGYKDYNKLNTVQHRAMRCFLGVGKYTAIPALYGEMCWTTPIHRRHLDMVRYFVRLINMDKKRLPYRIFLWDYSRPRRDTWCHEIKTILELCGLGELYVSHKITLPNMNVVSHVQKQLRAVQEAEWHQARQMPKLRNYNLVRDMWNTPTYINKYLSRTERAHIAKMYCGNLPLRVETGRYRNVPLNERLCTYCQLDEIEDDVHFIVRCPLHTDLRLTLMANIHMDLDSNLSAKDLFIYICFNAPPKALGQYIIKGMQRRQSIVS